MGLEPRAYWFFGTVAAIVLSLLAVLLILDPNDDDSGCGDALSTVDIFAASSLAEAFEDIWDARRAERECFDEIPAFNFAGSQQLRIQIVQAGGDGVAVFASADREQMDLAVRDGKIEGEPKLFARNRLVVIVPEGNDAGIETLQDLANDDVKIVIAGEEVPAGAYARSFLEQASADPAFGADYSDRVLENVVSEETNVRFVVARVQLGEADAGIVYATDALADVADDVEVIEIPDELNELAEYWIATREGYPEALGSTFVDYVLSDAGQAILAAHGFIRVDQ